MAKQLPPVTDIDLYRGTTWPIDFVHDHMAADVVDAQIGFNVGSSDVYKITMSGSPAQWDIQDNTGTVTILPAESQNVMSDSLPYDIKLKLTDDTVDAVQRGLLEIADDVSGAFD